MNSILNSLLRIENSLNTIENRLPKPANSKPGRLFKERIEEFQKVISKIDTETTPRVSTGKTRVYLPHSPSDIVVKATGSDAAKERLKKIQKAQSLVEQLNIRCLVIPEALHCGEFLIAKRLPIRSDFHHSMALYCSEPRLFDQAVREAVQLFRVCDLCYIVCRNAHPLNFPEVGNYVKYDNIPLYIDMEGDGSRIGKIGLIDLERFTEEPSDKALETLTRIFPFHLPIIIEEAEHLGMGFDSSTLEDAAKQGALFLELCYINPYNQYVKNGLTSDFIKFRTVEIEGHVSQNIKNELKTIILKPLVDSDSENKEYEKCLREASDEMFSEVLKIVNECIDMAFIKKIKGIEEDVDLKYPIIPVTTCLIKPKDGLSDKLLGILFDLYRKMGNSCLLLGLLTDIVLDSIDLILGQLAEEDVLLQVQRMEIKMDRGRRTVFWVRFDPSLFLFKAQ